VIEPLSPESLTRLRQAAAVGVVASQVLVNLLERVEALEARPIPGAVELVPSTPEAAPKATLRNALLSAEAALSDIAEGEETNAAPNTFKWAEQRCAEALAIIRPVMQQHGIRTSGYPPADAQPAPPAAPAGGLVERVVAAIWEAEEPAGEEYERAAIARVAIRHVAACLDLQGQHGCSLLLREEADQ
jgi:hypothetical protein